MRCIDADALIHELNNSHYPGAPYVDAGISIAVGKVCDAPTIEPEIVRCKDCKWFHDIGCAIRIVDDSDKPSENDYCSFAERKTDGN